MSKRGDSAGSKFKELEKKMRFALPDSEFTGLRLDGKSFHTFTRQFERPYDLDFMAAMDSTAIFILEKLFTDALFAYVQSDEITIILSKGSHPESEYLFGGKVEKILSTSSSAATGGFMTALPSAQGVPIFDARLFQLSSFEELEEYTDWRRLDARKNSISMAVHTLKSARELDRLSTNDRLGLLQGTYLETLPDGFMWGRFIVKEEYSDSTTFVNSKTQEKLTEDIIRSRWISTPALRSTSRMLLDNTAYRSGVIV